MDRPPWAAGPAKKPARSLLFGASPLAIILLALVIYIIMGLPYGAPWSVSPYPYYNYLADAFLHGQLHLRIVPERTHDLVLYNGQYYLYWPPFPAVVLLPFVALLGVGFSDVLLNLALATLNVWLVWLVLKRAQDRGLLHLSDRQRGILLLFFALGTVHVTLAPYGRIWFTGQLFAFLFLALAYLAALSLRGWAAFVLTGLAIAAAALTRNHLFVAALWPGIYLLVEHRQAGWKRLTGYTLLAALPVVVGMGLMGLYNLARFGGLLSNGLPYHLMASSFVGDYWNYGAFSLHYLPQNLFYQYVAYPFPLQPESFMGGSLFLLSPVFIGAFWGIARGRPRWSTWTLLGTILLINIPILLLMGTGWVQFGPRYTYDFHLPLLLLTAIGIERWKERPLLALTVISIVQYVLGAVALGSLFRVWG